MLNKEETIELARKLLVNPNRAEIHKVITDLENEIIVLVEK